MFLIAACARHRWAKGQIDTQKQAKTAFNRHSGAGFGDFQHRKAGFELFLSTKQG
jgi:hypothetical protein